MPITSNPLKRQTDKLGSAIVAADQRKVRALLARGISPDCVVWNWDTALFLAVRLRRVAIVRILLEAGASTAPGASGRSPLADASRKGSVEITTLLQRHGVARAENG